ncbi:MAG: UPF0280 family protein [Dethiobacter sp.]|jgi:ApbE superfamily uncharacterized protein (UPF0280 family)|nr:UPF0280 family protein [Dethiobacter sp.]
MKGDFFLTAKGPGKIFLDYGPVQMLISASSRGKPLAGRQLKAAAGCVKELLETLSACLPLAKQPPAAVSGKRRQFPEVLCRMAAAVNATGDTSLTSMAAVAGTFADCVADFLQELGADTVIVNNGGDIALRLPQQEFIRVGIAPFIGSAAINMTLTIAEQDGWRGIATSGLGGRSLTQGIATSVTVLAGSASLADACATLIANSTYHEDPSIIRRPAREVDPDTDIAELPVTVALKDPAPEVFRRALENGLASAQELYSRGLIGGSVLTAGPYCSCFPPELAARLDLHDSRKITRQTM